MQLNFHCSDVSCDQSFQVPLLIMNLGNFCKVVVLRIRIVKIAQNARQSELSKRGIHMQFRWNSHFFHQIPSLTSLQTEHINSRTFGALLKPLGFLDLVGSGISFAPSCQSLCPEGGGGAGSSYSGYTGYTSKMGMVGRCWYTHKPFFVWKWMGWMLEFGESLAKATEVSFKIRPARVTLMSALSGTWCSMWLAILRTSCRGHPA